MPENSRFQHIWLEVSVILLAILISLLFLPIFIFILLPIYIWRFFTSIILRRLLRPDLRSQVHVRSAIWTSSDQVYTRPECNIVIAIVFEGILSLDTLYQNVETLLVNARNTKEKLTCPEFTHYLEDWLGFTWWKKDESFDLCNHIKYYCPEETPINEEQLVHIRTELDRKPWPQKRSPWIVQIIPNFTGEHSIDGEELSPGRKSVLLISMHHGLGDGLSFISILMNRFKDHKIFALENIQEPKFLRWNSMRKFLEVILFPIKAPYLSAGQILRGWDENALRNKNFKPEKFMIAAQSHKIPISFVKEVKKAHSASFTGILIAAITGGIRKYMLQNKMEVPQDIHFVSSFPIPVGPIEKMGNYYSFVFLRLPVGEKDPRRRVKLCEDYILNMKNSILPIVNFIAIPFIGGLLTPMVKYMFKNRYTTGILSNFPGPNKLCEYQGLKALDVQFFGGTMCGDTGIGLSSVSYNNFIRINTGLSTTFCRTGEKSKELLQYVLEEFSILNHCEIV